MATFFKGKRKSELLARHFFGRKSYTYYKSQTKLSQVIFLMVLITVFMIISWLIFYKGPEWVLSNRLAGLKDRGNATGPIGDTFGGSTGPLIAWMASVLTFAAFWVQFKSNEQQRNQFRKQSEDQLFFKLMDGQESQVLNATVQGDHGEHTGHAALEYTANQLMVRLQRYAIELGKQQFIDNPESIPEEDFKKLARSLQGSLFKGEKSDYINGIKNLSGNERTNYFKNKFIGIYGEGQASSVYEEIGTRAHYGKIDDDRRSVYRVIVEALRKRAPFIDTYLKGWEFIFHFCEEAENKTLYVEYIDYKLNTWDHLILFYFRLSNTCSENFKKYSQHEINLSSYETLKSFLLPLSDEEQIMKEFLLLDEN